jgi:hypothetical protein
VERMRSWVLRQLLLWPCLPRYALEHRKIFVTECDRHDVCGAGGPGPRPRALPGRRLTRSDGMLSPGPVTLSECCSYCRLGRQSVPMTFAVAGPGR